MPTLGPWAWILVGYLVAAIPVGLIVGKLRRVDLREVGSGNIGATNAVRALGPGLGAFVLLLDVAKAGTPLWLAARDPGLVAASPWPSWPQFWIAAVGFACVLGHIFPVYLGFRGGKGVACALGILGVVHWPTAVGTLVVYAVTIALVRVSSVASLVALTAACAMVCVSPFAPALRVLVIAMTAVIWWRHRENFDVLPEKLIDAGDKKMAKRAPTLPPGSST